MAPSIISVQLWSVRDELARDGWDAVLRVLAGEGFAHVEPFALADTAPLLDAPLRAAGLTTPTVHGDITGTQLERTLDAAIAHEATLLVHPGFPAARWYEPGGVDRIAADLQRAADAAAPHGLRVAFHNHDDDLRARVDGRPALLALFDRVGPGVGVEFDPNWCAIAGEPVVDTVRALGSRMLALHLKDGPAGGANEDQVAVGDGDLDWRSILAAIPAGIPLVIGLDEHAGDSLDAVLRSRARLLELLRDARA
ncbi:sugar phosphate isomerase/epimerase family protein [Microbacterium sp. NPDC055683]